MFRAYAWGFRGPYLHHCYGTVVDFAPDFTVWGFYARRQGRQPTGWDVPPYINSP